MMMAGDGEHTDRAGSPAITLRECAAMRLLSKDGWNEGELAMTFMVDESTVKRHVNEHCKAHKIVDND